MSTNYHVRISLDGKKIMISLLLSVGMSLLYFRFTYSNAIKNLWYLVNLLSNICNGLMQNLVGSKTRMENLQGKLVVPGFIDSHVHFIFGGLQVLDMHILAFITVYFGEKVLVLYELQ